MDYTEAFDRVIGAEGGYSNDPTDAGGETNWGISKRAYPNLDIKLLTREDAKAIYQRDFWMRIGGRELPYGIVYQVFDFAVNSGIETAVRSLQKAAGVAPDGHFGPVTRNAIHGMPEGDLIMRFCAERIDFMTRLSTWEKFGKGWTRRIAQNLRYAAVDTNDA